VTPGDDFLDLRLGDFLDLLASDRPVPAGGSATAAAVGAAAAIVAKAARLSTRHWREAGGALAQAEALRARAAPLAKADAEAYADALATLRAPAGGSQEARDAEIGAALSRAADVPLAIAVTAADVADLAAAVAENGNPNLRADAAAAAVLAEAGARAAANLVAINLSAIADDERVGRADALHAAAAAEARRALAAC
jgi:methenyltetrahydrofolate cyclohydrolase